ncbi:hypothetical protein BCV70DRAFT_44862 [Testicularia cyperi]|uniref:Uncharacterized protein n=1 Tax=Testicularia cyperi TaxID=1882483 RepID=A0A317XIR9_9BASI|nr:hypothetical protein BCV70DRAFT_44862 [Testicularia cyperi]
MSKRARFMRAPRRGAAHSAISPFSPLRARDSPNLQTAIPAIDDALQEVAALPHDTVVHLSLSYGLVGYQESVSWYVQNVGDWATSVRISGCDNNRKQRKSASKKSGLPSYASIWIAALRRWMEGPSWILSAKVSP